MSKKGFGLGRLFQRDEQQGVAEDETEQEQSVSVERMRPPPGTKVLVVDDSRTIQSVLVRMLGKYGYEAHSAYDGENAVSLARELLPSVILMDVVMPGMNGFQATREIRHDADPNVAAIPVLIMSGNAQPTEELWSTKIKANGFLAKPFEDDELLTYIEKLLYPAAVEA